MDLGIADHQPGEIDGEEAGAADRAGSGKDQQRQRQHEDRQQALVEVQPLDQPGNGKAAGDADRRAQSHRHDEADDEIDDQHLGGRVGAARDHLDQRDGQEDGDRIVGAGFDFEDRADAVAQIDVAGAQQEEHRRRVGRGDGGAEQQQFQPGKAGEIVRGGAENHGGQRDADGGQRNRRQRRLPQHAERRAETGIEQDDGQRQRTDHIGGGCIVELDAESVGAAGQPDGEEEKQDGSAEAEGDQARKRRSEHQRGCNQRYGIKCLIHPVRVPRIDAMKSKPCSCLKAQCGEDKARRAIGKRRIAFSPTDCRQTNARPRAGRCRMADEADRIEVRRSALPNATAVSAMRFEKPHSLSYQDSADTKSPSITLVWSSATVEECGSWLKSIDTFG